MTGIIRGEMRYKFGSYSETLKNTSSFLSKHGIAVSVFLSGFAGCIAFIAIYGVQVLDITYDDWIRNATGDFAQSYYGWRFFRASQWHWPIGLMDGVAYPSLTPILYIDSVPIFNIIFKLLSPLLPTTVQFFGVWGLLCFILDGAFSGALVYKFTNNITYSTIGSIFFTLTTFSIQRLYTHTALAANWIILLCLVIIVFSSIEGCLVKQLVAWFFLFFAAISVNIYYIPIIGIMMVAYCVYRILRTHKYKRSFYILLVSFTGTLMAFYLYGGFYHLSSGVPPMGDEFGHLGANLNTLFNPMQTGLYLTGWSRFMESQPQTNLGQYEGYAYLGFGLILLLIVAMCGVLTQGRDSILNFLATRRIELMTGVGACVVLSLASFGPHVTLGSHTLFTIPYPEAFLKLYSVFRSMGRFMWGVWDIAALTIIVCVYKTYSRKVAVVLTSASLLIQIADISPMLENRSELYMQRQQSYTALVNEQEVDKIMQGKKHVMIFSSASLPLQSYYDIAQVALAHKATLNDFYYSRRDSLAIESYKKEVMSNLEQGVARNDTVYVFNTFEDAFKFDRILKLYFVDGLVFGVRNSVDDLRQIYSGKKLTQVQVAENEIRLPVAYSGQNVAIELAGQGADTVHIIADNYDDQYTKAVDGGSKCNAVVRVNDQAVIQFDNDITAYKVSVYAIGAGE